jgi:hypothetical protein
MTGEVLLTGKVESIDVENRIPHEAGILRLAVNQAVGSDLGKSVVVGVGPCVDVSMLKVGDTVALVGKVENDVFIPRLSAGF